MKENRLYVVCLIGIPIAIFDDLKEAERFRIRRFTDMYIDSSLHYLAFRDTPVSQILAVTYSNQHNGYIIREAVTVQQYSRNAVQASLNFDDDLPPA